MGKKKERCVRICPMCGSTDMGAIISGSGGFVCDYCKNCGGSQFTGVVLPEVVKSRVNEFKDEITARPKRK